MNEQQQHTKEILQYFEQSTLQQFEFLISDLEYSVSSSFAGRFFGQIVIYVKNESKIEICYEIFGPPWCSRYRNDQQIDSIEVEHIKNESGAKLATLGFATPTKEIVEEHKKEIYVWLSEAAKKLRNSVGLHA